MKKFILFALIGISIAWLTYVAYDIFSTSNQFDPRFAFSYEDEELIVILRPDETNIDEIPSLQESVNKELIYKLSTNNYQTAYISRSREHILIEGKESWNKERIIALFGPISSVKFGSKSFQINEYQGIWSKSKIYLSAKKFDRNEAIDGFKFDKKASAVVLSINSKNEVESRSELYFQENGILKFITNKNEQLLGRKVDDAQLFSKVIPSDISSYHFKERDYWSSQDSVFASGPMLLWLDKGFVEIEVNGEIALISDFIEGQDPDLVLNDFTQTFDTSWFKAPLSSSFPRKGKSYTFRVIDNLVVFSSSERLCEHIQVSSKLGQTVAMDEVLKSKLYTILPKQVSERSFNKENTFASSVYRNELHQSYVRKTFTTPLDRKKPSSSISFALSEDIQDFWYDAKKDLCFIIGVNGKAALYASGKQIKVPDVEGKPLSKINCIDLFDNGELHFMFTTKDKLYLINQNGQSPSGFPVDLESTPTADPYFYRWKGGSYFLVPIGKELYHFNGKGGELNVVKSKYEINAPLVVWASQSKLFAGYSNASNFTMYDLDRRQVYREFDIPNESVYLKFPNEVIHYGIDGGKLLKVDQKGSKTRMEDLNGKFLQAEHAVTRSLIIKNGSKLTLTNEHGLAYGSIDSKLDDIGGLDVSQTNNGLTILALLDGLENNVYLYLSNGKQLGSKPVEGSRKVMLETTESEAIVTTVVGQFVVKYNVNY